MSRWANDVNCTRRSAFAFSPIRQSSGDMAIGFGAPPIHLDLRVIAATNQDLNAQLERGLYREDLYYRLSVVSIRVPALRERGQDLPLLAKACLRRAAQEQRRRVRFSPEALRALMAYPWPGNIRELENRISRAVIMVHGRRIEPAHLDLPSPAPEPPPASLRQARESAQREALRDALSRHRGNISQAARELQVSRPTLHGLLEKYRLKAEQFR